MPGLVEGAAGGRGLGHEFLRHVERCAATLHVVDAAAADPVGDFLAVREELSAFDAALAAKPFSILINKRDLVEPDALARVEADFEALGHDVAAASAATGDGVATVARRVRTLAREARAGG